MLRQLTALAVPRVGFQALLIALTFAGVAHANEWPITPSQPAGSIQAAPEGVYRPLTFQFQGAPVSGVLDSVYITVWSRNPNEAGNLFPEQARVDFFPASPSPVDPTIYQGNALGPWTNTPGTYYWRATATVLVPPYSTPEGYVSPLFGLALAPSTSSIPIQLCNEIGIRIRELTHRIRVLTITIDRTQSTKRTRKLVQTRSKLSRERAALNREAYQRCVQR